MELISLLQSSDIGQVDADDKTLQTYSADASIFEVRPQAVVSPESLEQLQALVRLSSEHGFTLTPRAAGTCMSGGSLTEGVMVDMKPGFGWVGEVEPENQRIWVGAGAYHRDLAAKVSEAGLLFAPYTSSKDICVIGGMIGNNASGEKSIRYGATIDNVERLRVVLSDGNEYEFGPLSPEEVEAKRQLEGAEGDLYRQVTELVDKNWDLIWRKRPKVRKNAAGYALDRLWDRDKTEFNLAKLFVGAQGTLGFVTAAYLKLVPQTQFTRMMVVPIKNLTELAEGVQMIMAHKPEGLETYDKHTYELAKEYLPDEAGLASVAEGQELLLFAQFSEATKDLTDHAEDVCQKALQRKGYHVHTVTDDAEREAHWTIRRASYGLLKDHPHGKRAVPFIEDTIISIDHYGEFLAALEAILGDYHMTYTFAGHIGDGSIRLIPLVDMEAEDADEQIFSLAERTYNLVFAFGGSMSVDHNDGLIRTPFLAHMYGDEMVELFARIKSIFDPASQFNPGKKVANEHSLTYAKEHVSRRNNLV